MHFCQSYPAYKPSGVKWLGDVPAHWDVTAVKRCYSIKLGKMLQNAPKHPHDVEVPYLKAQHVQWFQVLMAEVPKMWASQSEARQFGIEAGDLLVCEGGEGGRCAILNEQIDNCIIQNALHRVRPREQSLNVFLQYVMSTVAATGWFDALNDKATIAHFTKEKFDALRIPLPPLAEQRAIVRYLDHVDRGIQDYIEAKEKLIAQLQEARRAIIHRAVTRGLDPSVPLKPSGVEWLGDVPAHWEISRVKSVFISLNHRRVPLNAVERGEMKERRYDYYGASGVIDKVDDYLFDDELLLIAEDGANLVLRSLPLAIIARGKFWVNNHAHILKPRRGNLEFLAAVMEGLNYIPWISGAAQPKLTQERLMNITIAVPSRSEQDEIMSKIESQTSKLSTAIDTARRQVEFMAEYRASLIAHVVTGKLDVRAAAEQLPQEAHELAVS